MNDQLPGGAVTAAAERVASVLRRDLPQYMPDEKLRRMALDAAVEALEAAAAAIAAGERARIRQLLLGSLVPVFYDNGYPVRAVPQAAVLDLIGGAP